MVGFSGLSTQQRRSIEALTSPFGALFRKSGGSGFKPASDEMLRRMMEEAQGGGNGRKRRRPGGKGCRVCGGVGVGRSCEWCPKGDEERPKGGTGEKMMGVVGFDIAVEGWVDGPNLAMGQYWPPDLFWPVKSPTVGVGGGTVWSLVGEKGDVRGYLDRSDPLSR